MMPGQVQQGGTKEREHAHRCFVDADNRLRWRKQVQCAHQFIIADMHLLHGSIPAGVMQPRRRAADGGRP